MYIFFVEISLQLAFLGQDFGRDRPIPVRIQGYVQSINFILGMASDAIGQS